MRKSLLFCFGLAAAGLLMSILLWNQVPNPMPIHWNLAGQADGFASRGFGLLIMPLIAGLIPLFVVWLARQPKRVEGNQKPLAVILVAITSFMLLMHVLMISASLTAGTPISLKAVFAAVGGLVIVMGWTMPMMKRNWAVGVRTPWAMDSGDNWQSTHRFARWPMVGAGLVCMLSSLLLSAPALVWVSMSALILGSVAPVAHSYLFHRRQG